MEPDLQNKPMILEDIFQNHRLAEKLDPIITPGSMGSVMGQCVLLGRCVHPELCCPFCVFNCCVLLDVSKPSGWHYPAVPDIYMHAQGQKVPDRIE